MNVEARYLFATLPEWILYADVSPLSVRLWCVLQREADRKTKRATIGRGKLAEILRCSTDTVDRAMKELVELGAVGIRERYRDGAQKVRLPNQYVLINEPPPSRTVAGGGTDAATGTSADTAPAPTPGGTDAHRGGRKDAEGTTERKDREVSSERKDARPSAEPVVAAIVVDRPTKRQLMFEAICANFDIDWERIPPKSTTRGVINAQIPELIGFGIEPEEISGFITWLKHDPSSPLVSGNRLTIGSLGKWAPYWRARPQSIEKIQRASLEALESQQLAEQTRRRLGVGA